MKITNEVATHEAGHLVVGLHLGIEEQGIVFQSNADEGAQAWFTEDDPAKRLRRSLAGLLAQVVVLPDSIEPRLLAAYQQSIILTPEHPDYDNVPAADREFLSGAKTDMALARGYATQLHPRNATAAKAALRESEVQVRRIVTARADDITRVAADIRSWATEPDREDDGLPLYPAQRANKFVRKA